MTDEYDYEDEPTPESDFRWIVDAVGHRRAWKRMVAGRDGTTVDTPFGEAVNIVMPAPDDDAQWVCDLCNGLILTRWGDEPFPVPQLSSYALCLDCMNRIMESEGRDRWGDYACTCTDCRAWMVRWFYPEEVRT